MADVRNFDISKYTESVAAVSGISESKVIVTSLDYQVKVGYSLPDTVTVSQATAAIASLHNVGITAVSVTKTRRLSTGRFLAAQSFEATITTGNANIATTIAAQVGDTAKLATELSLADAEVSVASQAKTLVKLQTQFQTVGELVEPPDASSLEKELEQNLGVPVTASVTNIVKETTAVGVDGARGLHPSFIWLSCVVAVLSLRG